jgi:hypothetical protein
MPDTSNKSRRSFLKTGPSLALAAAASSADAKIPFKRTSPGSRNLLEVGLLFGPGGHSNGIWGRFFNPTAGEIRRLGMIYTKVWSADRAHAESFGKKFGIEVVDKFDGMVDKVDGVMIDDFDAVAYNHKLAQPYLEAGIPTFINRPFADSIRKARGMLDLAKKHNAPIMTGSSYEHLQQIFTIRAKMKKEDMTEYEAWNACSDYYSHGLHGVWGAYAAVGGGIEAVSLACRDWRKSEGSVTTISYKDRGKGVFTGTVHEGQKPNEASHWFAIIIQPGNQAQFFTSMDAWGIDEFMWLPMLHRIQWMFETGGLFQTHEEILEKSALFTGAFYSCFERGGRMVRLAEIPEDWAIGSPYGFGNNGPIDAYARLFGKEEGEIQPK